MQASTPEELVRWCQQTLPDDTRAFEQLVSQYKLQVFLTAYRLMGNKQDAEDQAQEAFLKIYRGIKNLAEPAKLGGWITRVTINTCLDALAKQERRPATTPLVPPEATSTNYADIESPSPEEAVLRGEVRHCIERALAKLEPQTRAILVLRDVNDYSYQEIAEALRLGLSAVKMRIHRARLAFQRILSAICPDVS